MCRNMPRSHWCREVGTSQSFPAHTYEGERIGYVKSNRLAHRFTERGEPRGIDKMSRKPQERHGGREEQSSREDRPLAHPADSAPPRPPRVDTHLLLKSTFKMLKVSLSEGIKRALNPNSFSRWNLENRKRSRLRRKQLFSSDESTFWSARRNWIPKIKTCSKRRIFSTWKQQSRDQTTLFF